MMGCVEEAHALLKRGAGAEGQGEGRGREGPILDGGAREELPQEVAFKLKSE